VEVFDADGSSLPRLSPFPLDTSIICACAVTTGQTPQLLVSDGSVLVSVNPYTHEVQWSNPDCKAHNIALLSKHGVAAVSASVSLNIVRLSDGFVCKVFSNSGYTGNHCC